MAAGVAADVPGDVQDPVAQSFGFADAVLCVERQSLRPDDYVMAAERELEPCCVGGEGVRRQVVGAGGLERLDAVLDLSVLAVGDLERGDVRVGLVGDEAVEAMAI